MSGVSLTSSNDALESAGELRSLSKSVRRKLASLRSSIQTMFVAHGLARVTMLCVGLLFWHMLTDAVLELPWTLRLVAMLAMLGVVTLATLRWIIYPLTRPFSELDLALLVEREYPSLKDRLVTALQMLDRPERYQGTASADLVRVTVHDGLTAASKLRFGEVIRSRRLALETLIALVLVGAFATTVLANQGFANTWSQRLLLGSAEYPRDTHLSVNFPTEAELAQYPTDDVIDLNFTYDHALRTLNVARGTGLRVIAKPHGEIPREAELYLRDPSGSTSVLDMSPEYRDTEGDRELVYFHYNIQSLLQITTGENERYELWVESGDAREGPFYINTVEPPALQEDTRLTLRYPSYMRLEDKVIERRRALEDVPEGTQATFDFETTQPLTAEGGAILRFYSSGSDAFEVEVPAANDERTHFRLEDQPLLGYNRYEYVLTGADTLRNTEKYDYDIKIVSDRPPEVKLEFYGRGLKDEALVPVTPGARLPLRYKVTDTYGVASLRVLYTIAEPGNTEMEWRELTSFASAQELKIKGVEELMDGLRGLGALMEETIGLLKESGVSDSQKRYEAFLAYRTTIDESLEALELLEDQRLISLDPENRNTMLSLRDDFSTVKKELYENFGPSVFGFDSALTGFEERQKSVEQLLESGRAYAKVVSTNIHEEFVLEVNELLEDAQSRLVEERDLEGAIKILGNKPVSISLKFVAEDRNLNPDTGTGGREESKSALLELMTKSMLINRISRYIRNTLKKDLQRITRSELELLRETRNFVAEKRSLVFSESDEGRESRRMLSSAQLTQGGLPDETRRLAENFGNVAQAYIFNELEANKESKDQETRIQTIRIMLSMLSAEVPAGDAMAGPLNTLRSDQADRADRIAAVDKVISELGLDDDLTGLRPSFSRMRFAELVATTTFDTSSSPIYGVTFETAASLTRLDAHFKSLMRSDASAESRRRELNSIVDLQEQTLAGLEIVRQRLDLWEEFDAIRQSLEDWKKELERTLDGYKGDEAEDEE